MKDEMTTPAGSFKARRAAGAVAARRGDSYAALAKAADEALYRAKEGHNGGFEAAGL